MSDYTPTTEEIKDALPSGRLYAQFDRWLAEVKAQAWEEGWQAGYRYHSELHKTSNQPKRENPYRQGEKQ